MECTAEMERKRICVRERPSAGFIFWYVVASILLSIASFLAFYNLAPHLAVFAENWVLAVAVAIIVFALGAAALWAAFRQR